MNEDKDRKFGYGWNTHPRYRWTDDMAEASGMGGEYEEFCRYNITVGLDFLDGIKDEYPKYIPTKNKTTNTTGVYSNNLFYMACDNDKVEKDLEKVLTEKPMKYFGDGWGHSGGTYGTSIFTIRWVLSHSWEEYVRVSRDTEEKRRQKLLSGQWSDDNEADEN